MRISLTISSSDNGQRATDNAPGSLSSVERDHTHLIDHQQLWGRQAPSDPGRIGSAGRRTAEQAHRPPGTPFQTRDSRSGPAESARRRDPRVESRHQAAGPPRRLVKPGDRKSGRGTEGRGKGGFSPWREFRRAGSDPRRRPRRSWRGGKPRGGRDRHRAGS